MSTVTVHALSTGSITLPERFFIIPHDPEARRTVPSVSFLIQHTSKDGHLTRVVFDLGIRRDISLYPPVLQKHCSTREPITTEPDAVASLASGGLTPKDIDLIIFSHVHYDHVGLPSDFPAPTKFLVGPGAQDLLSGASTLDIGSHSFFEADLLPPDRTTQLPSPNQPPGTNSLYKWKPLFPFPHAIDLFNDQTVYIINAPGHLPGHINLLCKLTPDTSTTNPHTSPNSSKDKYVYLAGDACHDIRLFDGTHDIATWKDDRDKVCCIHADIPAAKETLARLREVQKEGFEGREGQGKAEVEVVFAHNWQWEEDAKGRGRYWPGKL